ncbi:hypothetical protein KOI40_13650 [Aestuariicella sp. G3-2]|uniref:exosortase-dependent surface protein XDP1 n=1 Tax=Pseudomaricurvus albidus TaxID=2842452 RepID=UPI001C0E71A0|nr:exosortase-dependent surface protein XDP1 [Aestuariicella albida]MBU3070866.1 hypothetical protein [Aestuariicella albida]
MLLTNMERTGLFSTSTTKKLSGVLAIFCLSLASLDSQAAVDPTWDFTGSYSNTSAGLLFQSTNSSMTATVSGWADTGAYGGINNFSNELVQFGSSGLGLDRQTVDDGDHEIDNYGHQEFLVFHFSAPVSISGYNFGYIDTDSDSTLLAYQGANDDLGLSSSDGTDQLVDHGWTAIGHYLGNSGTYSVDSSGQTGGIYSSYWIIGSYLSDVSANLFSSSWYSYTDGKKDAFKLSSLTSSTPTTPPGSPPTSEAPAPASLGLFLGGLYLLRRRVKKQQKLATHLHA